MSTEDGPGLRTTVFFKGCPLSCTWCHNPESLSFKQELEWFPDRCISCRTCENVCPNDAISFLENIFKVDYSICSRCMICTTECPSNALEAKGHIYEADELAVELLKDKAYFGKSGGITLSGGEALAQPGFAVALAGNLHAEGISIAIDTCGLVPFESIEKIFPYADIFLYDIKLMDSVLHKKYTGSGNEIILENLTKLSEMIKASGKRLWIRTPIIPGITDTKENIALIRDFINNALADSLERWELCAFNNLCSAKYERLGREWDFKGVGKLSREKIDVLMKTATHNSSIKNSTFATGSLKIENKETGYEKNQ